MVRSILSFLSMLLWAPALALAQAGQGSPGSPGNAPAGTGATMLVPLLLPQLVGVAVVPLNFNVLEPWLKPKFVPEMATL